MSLRASRVTIVPIAALSIAFLLVLTGCPKNRYPSGIIELPRTGQTVSYASGDDGDLQMGVAWPEPRFTVDGETITDNLTGLMWETAGNLFHDEWADSITYIAGETIGPYDDWRMPNMVELLSLLGAAAADPGEWLNGLGFTDIQDSYYFTSTTCASETGNAHGVRMGTANGNAVAKTGVARYTLAVRGQSVGAAVELPQTGQTASYATGDDGDLRSGIAWPDPRFYVNENGTISDALTGLVWDAKANRVGGTWEQVLDDAAGQVIADWSDWRVPNVVEMTSLLNLGSVDAVAWLTSVGFTDVQAGLYWTSTTCAASTDQAWCIDTGSNGWPSNEDKLDAYGTFLVRGPGAD